MKGWSVVRNFGHRSWLAVGVWQHTVGLGAWKRKTTSDGTHRHTHIEGRGQERKELRQRTKQNKEGWGWDEKEQKRKTIKKNIIISDLKKGLQSQKEDRSDEEKWEKGLWLPLCHSGEFSLQAAYVVNMPLLNNAVLLVQLAALCWWSWRLRNPSEKH